MRRTVPISSHSPVPTESVSRLFFRPFGACVYETRIPTASAVGCILAPLCGWPLVIGYFFSARSKHPARNDRLSRRCRRFAWAVVISGVCEIVSRYSATNQTGLSVVIQLR